MIKEQLGIYIHIPFCARKCNYCDFLSCRADYDMMKKYTESLIKEMRIESEYVNKKELKTIFIGGGTPSILPVELMESILQSLNEYCDMSSCIEFSMECNPGTLNADKLDMYRQYGVNRLSIGLQSANDKELKMLGRIHTFEDFLQSYYLAREKHYNNINIDLMSALPYQTRETYLDTLKKVVELNPEHISAYSLIIEDGTPMKKMVEIAKENPLPDETAERDMYYDTKRVLHENGYERYEISNYSKSGRECIHNMSYWRRTSYIGLGIGASSYIEGTRYNNISDFQTYFDILQKADKRDDIVRLHENVESLTKQDMMEEYMFLGLRMMEGVSVRTFYEEFGKTIDDVYGDILQKHIDEKLIERSDDRIRLTELGIDVSNYVFSDYIF